MEPGDPHIVDLRTRDPLRDPLQSSLRQEIIEGLTKQELLVPGHAPAAENLSYAYRKTIPTVVLYDNVGLELYDQITAVEDYYPFPTELAILKAKGSDIACRLIGISTSSKSESDPVIYRPALEGEEGPTSCTVSSCSPLALPDNEVGFRLALVELGAGSLKKTSYLLRNVAKILQRTSGIHAEKILSQAEYYALDLEPEQLRSTLSAIQAQKDSGIGPAPGDEVQTFGLCGTYSQGLDWIRNSFTPRNQMKVHEGQINRCRKAILWLGSSIGNLSPSEAIDFLKDELGRVLDTETRVLIGIDNCQLPEKVQRAYDDSHGVTRKFILNAINVVARHLGLKEDVLNPDQFEYVSRYNIQMKRHEAYLRARQKLDLRIPTQGSDAEAHSIRIEAGEMIMIERSYKYSPDMAYRVFDQAGLRVIQKWSDIPNSSSSNSNKLWAPTHTLYLVERAAFHFVRTSPFPSTADSKWTSVPQMPKVHNVIEPPSKKQPMLNFLDKIASFSLSLGIFNHDKVQSVKKQLAFATNNPEIEPKPIRVLNEDQNSKSNYGGIPSMSDWNTLWKAWDTLTLEMIPRSMLHHKPIDLRHAFLFYLGHIPVFADIHISRYFDEPNTEPQWFAEIFERGIDPSMDNPEKCHSHSQFPDTEDERPSLEELLGFRDKFRQRLTNLYKELGGRIELTRRLGRVLCMIHEHEAMHLETLLYMIQQMQDVNPPPGFTTPDWESLSREWNFLVATQGGIVELIEYPCPRTIVVGHDDLEEDDNSKPFSDTHEYGWDNESPSRRVVVKPFKLEATPVTNGEYLEFLLQNQSGTGPLAADVVPASWAYRFTASDSASGNHQIEVKTVYGHINFEFAKHWPVQASGSQLECFAKSKGGRLPTADELRVYFCDNPMHDSTQNPIGFMNWHPQPPQRPEKGHDGRWRGGWNGGVWEWTCTEFEPHPNFKPSELYPGYSKDFFDGEHRVLLGGSWATTPRIAHRQSFVNWYQFKYPYVFAGGRVAYDYPVP